MTIRPLLHVARTLALAALVAVPGLALAQTYPSQPIKLIVPFAPGGAVDQVARVIAPALQRSFGQQIVVENHGGASGSIGAADLAHAKPDGYTLMLALDSQAVNHLMVKNLPFDTFKSFDYLSLLVTLPQVLVVNSTSPIKTMPEFVAWVKAHPGATYGSAGTGSAGHVNSAVLSIRDDLTTTHVPYKGAGPLLTDLLGGHIDFAFAGLSVMQPQIKAGTLRAIAMSSAKRNPAFPDVPTVSESLPGFEIPTWVGAVAPVGLAPDVRAKVLAAFRDAMADSEVRARLAEATFTVVNGSPEDFAARVKKDADVMADLVQRKIVVSE